MISAGAADQPVIAKVTEDPVIAVGQVVNKLNTVCIRIIWRSRIIRQEIKDKFARCWIIRGRPGAGIIDQESRFTGPGALDVTSEARKTPVSSPAIKLDLSGPPDEDEGAGPEADADADEGPISSPFD